MYSECASVYVMVVDELWQLYTVDNPDLESKLLVYVPASPLCRPTKILFYPFCISLHSSFLLLGINILFQDVDLVWFRDPMTYFHNYMEDSQRTSATPVEAFFSDDGQRSKRYTPFYANSGFYYLLASERSVYFTWSIMIAMDAIQVLGSHQNVLTTRLIEGK
jgi:hypothetical protein